MQSSLKVVFFGPPQIYYDGRLLPQFRSRKSFWLFALLAFRNGRVVPREWVASTLWPDSELSVAFGNLRPALYDLRKALGAEAVRLNSPDRSTLCLDLRDVDVDVFQFDEAIAHGGSLDRAIELYSGQLLEGCDEEWVVQERAVRDREFSQALQILGDKAIAAQDWATAIDRFERLILVDPWRDSARRGLMTAHAASGDANAALHCYREFANLLSAETRTSPDAETETLYRHLRAEAQKSQKQRIEPATRTPPTISGHLPHALTPLVGREDDIADISAALRRYRLVTVCGPGGIGKTRTGVAVTLKTVEEYTDGARLVSLEGVLEDRLVLAQLAASLGIPETSALQSTERITRFLQGKTLLLVLDNCEHVQPTVGKICAKILQECGRVRILATSRHSLGVQGEKLWPLPPLPVPDIETLPPGNISRLRVAASFESIRLFVDRASAGSASFQMTAENVDAVVRICSKLQGVPLSIELAAAALRAMTVDALVARLSEILRLPSDGNRIGIERQRSIRATIDWSYQLLSREEKLLLHRLSVFAGSWTLEAAEQVVSFGEIAVDAVAELLRELLEKSILTLDTSSGRFYLLESVRQYAAEKLRDSDQLAATLQSHRNWCKRIAEKHLSLAPAAEEECYSEIDRENENIRAGFALNKSDQEFCIGLAAALWRYWYRRGKFSEGRALLEDCLQEDASRTPERATAAHGSGVLAALLGDFAAAETRFLESLEMRREHGDLKAIAASLDALGNVAKHLGNLRAAQEWSKASLEIRKELGDPRSLAMSLYNYGCGFSEMGEFRKSIELWDQVLAISRETGDSMLARFCLNSKGSDHLDCGELDIAQSCLEEALGIAKETGDRQSSSRALSLLGKLFMERGDLEAALAMAKEGFEQFEEIGDQSAAIFPLLTMGEIGILRGDLRGSEELLQRSLRISQTMDDKPQIAGSLTALAWHARQKGDFQAAKEFTLKSLKMMSELHQGGGIADCLMLLGTIASDLRDYRDSARFASAASSLCEGMGKAAQRSRLLEYERALERAQAELGSTRFEHEWLQVKLLPPEELIRDFISNVRSTDPMP